MYRTIRYYFPHGDECGKQIYELLSDGTVTMNLPEILK